MEKVDEGCLKASYWATVFQRGSAIENIKGLICYIKWWDQKSFWPPSRDNTSTSSNGCCGWLWETVGLLILVIIVTVTYGCTSQHILTLSLISCLNLTTSIIWSLLSRVVPDNRGLCKITSPFEELKRIK